MKKICFAIPVHEKKDVLIELIENIRYFCPNTSIVLFHSGNDPDLCSGLDLPVCPTSFPLGWGQNFPWFFLNIMEWLEEINHPYDYLINIDSDALFAKKGFEEFICSEMQGFDYMAAYLRVPAEEWYPGQVMKGFWPIFQPIFGIEQFLGCFMSAQVFSKNYVQQILHFDKIDELKKLLKQTEHHIFAMDEILFPTLAEALGIKSKPYPDDVVQWIRFRPHFTREEVVKAIDTKQNCYLIHPVLRDIADPARTFIRGLIQLE